MRIALKVTLVLALLLGMAPSAWGQPQPASPGTPQLAEKSAARRVDARQTNERAVRTTRRATEPDTTLRAKAAPSRHAARTASVIVGHKPGDQAKAIRASVAGGAKVTGRSARGGFFVVDVPAMVDAKAFIRELSREPGVEYVEPNSPVYAAAAPNDPGFASQWGMMKIGAPTAWTVTRGEGVTVAVVDSGVKATHEDLVGRVDVLHDYDFINDDTNADDDAGHGTHVAGIVAATLNNSLGVAGVANAATILPVKVLDADGEGDTAQVAEGIIYAADQGADVINLSLGAPDYSSTMDDAVQYAVSKDCVVVAATGNASAYGVIYPARLPNVIAVGSTTSADEISDFSNYGPQTDVCAPGSSVYSTLMSGGYGTMSGTSMATPHAAGVAALIRSLHPTWTRTQVENQLLGSAKDLGDVGHDDHFGYGRIDAAAAVGTVTPPPPVIIDDDDIPGAALSASPVAGELAGFDTDDVFGVHLDANQRISFELTGSAGTDFDLYFYDFDAASIWDMPIRVSEKSSYPESLSFTASIPGTYYVDVAAYDGEGSYSLTWATETVTPDPDDDIQGVPAPASPIRGTLDGNTDVDDVFGLHLNAGETVSVSLVGSATTEFRPYLYAPDAASVWVNEPVAYSTDSSYPREFTYFATKDGTYYLDASAYPQGGIGGYTMSYVIAAADIDRDVPGIPLATAPQTGVLDVDLDPVDVYALPVTAGQRISLDLQGPGGTDFDLFLFAPETPSVHVATPIASSAGAGSAERIEPVATQSGTYYVELVAKTGGGDYTLDYSLDNEIPGVPLPASPVSGSLSRVSALRDIHDVYHVSLVAGQWLYLALTGTSGTNFDLAVYGPGATTVEDPSPDRSVSSASSERMMFRAPSSGTYYVDVSSTSGSGAYTLVHALPADKPTLTLATPATSPYGASAVLTGVLRRQSGAALPGASVELYRALPGSGSWVFVTRAMTSATGACSFSVKLADKTDYQLRYQGGAVYQDAVSSTKTITPGVYLSAPKAPKTMSKSKYYSVYGYLKPKHASGTKPVKIKCYKKNSSGVYLYHHSVWAKASDYSTYSKYRASVKLPHRGTWRMRAYAPADAGHTAKYSSYDYVTVK